MAGQRNCKDTAAVGSGRGRGCGRDWGHIEPDGRRPLGAMDRSEPWGVIPARVTRNRVFPTSENHAWSKSETSDVGHALVFLV